MRKIRGGLLVAAIGFAGLAHGAPPSASVTVVNGTTNPVPVTGALGITGDVTIANTPDVNVVGLPGKAVEPGHAPYQRFEVFNQGPTTCTQFVCTVEFDAVPAGMRLVVSHIMGTFAMAAPASSPTVGVGTNSNIFSPTLRLPAQHAVGSVASYIASGQVMFFIEAGQRPTVYLSGNNVRDVSNSAQVGLVGYLVKL